MYRLLFFYKNKICSFLYCCLFIFICAYSFFCLRASANSTETIQQAPTVNTHNQPLHIHETVNSIAHYIAGVKTQWSDEFDILIKNASWQQYKNMSDERWSSFSKNKLKKINKFVATELTICTENTKTLFYPFSGPDFLYAYSMYPLADKFILVGLEPVGLIPNLKDIQEDALPDFFKILTTSIDDALTISFFKTNDMSEELCSKQMITGTLPILMLFLARTQNQIISIRPFEIDKSGMIVYLDSFNIYKGKKRFGKGAEIIFAQNADAPTKQLYYICADISDNGLTQNKNCLSFLINLDSNVVTFIKSASYLMHKNYFSQIRDIILSKSLVIIQDDSGIPYRFFKKSYWDIQLYGAYDCPIGLFKEHYEADLKAAYAQGSKQLNFRLGYATKSNLLLAKKKSEL